MTILFTVLFILLAIKGYINYQLDQEEQRESRVVSFYTNNFESIIEVKSDKQKEIELRKAFNRQRLQLIREIDLRKEYAIWKQNMQEYDSIRHKLHVT